MFHAKVVDFNEAYILSHVQNFHYDQPCFKNWQNFDLSLCKLVLHWSDADQNEMFPNNY